VLDLCTEVGVRCLVANTASEAWKFKHLKRKTDREQVAAYLNRANFNPNGEGGVKGGEYLERTTKVGSYPPNNLGLYDMHGNVWEWTGTAGGIDRATRGGAWNMNGTFCRAHVRGGTTPVYTDRGVLGFRVVRAPIP
jgi:formylglycine-generating enzyme required for sulfatase activity